jgi:hypothetical protein
MEVATERATKRTTATARYWTTGLRTNLTRRL